jgi:glycine betaine catabolism B
MRWIDNFLNKVTMYSLMLYFLIALVAISIVLAFLGYFSADPWQMLLNVAVLYGACKLLNPLFAYLFKVQTNSESSAITGLILALIVGPTASFADIWKLVLIAAIAMLSKFILVYDRRHLFNPAAIAVVLTAATINFGASWWVGNASLFPFVLIGGLLFLRKVRWFHLGLSYIVVYLALQSAFYLSSSDPSGLGLFLQSLLLYSPLLFFSFVMLTEPLTMPTGKKQRIFYGVLIGVLSVIIPRMIDASYGLELSLLAGNIIGLLIYGNTRRFMKFVGKQELAKNTAIFTFRPNKPLNFTPGQYLLWSIPHKKSDLRGHRRYFSIASSPTEDNFTFVTKFSDKSSSFKANLRQLPVGAEIMATSLDGDFVLPKDTHQDCVFIAGGVGIAPFRSMVKHLLDTKQGQTITLFYSNNTVDEICFTDLFDQANRAFGMKTIYTLTAADQVPGGWNGKVGYIDADMIKTEADNFRKALYYISGPDPMVRAMEKTLASLAIPKRQIKTDYFPGYA